jgi:prevent-host-death family protein
METTITATELAKGLSDVLNRVRYRNERFVVVRNGEPVATIGPPGPQQRVTTFGEILAKLGDLRFPGDGFADDLEAIHSSQKPIGAPPEWPD